MEQLPLGLRRSKQPVRRSDASGTALNWFGLGYTELILAHLASDAFQCPVLAHIRAGMTLLHVIPVA